MALRASAVGLGVSARWARAQCHEVSFTFARVHLNIELINPRHYSLAKADSKMVN